MLCMGLPGTIALLDFLPCDLTRCVLLLPQADASLHPLDGGVPQLSHYLAALGQVGVKSAEVDAILQGEDVGLVVQLQTQGGELGTNEFQRLPCRPHVRADHIPVVHIHPRQRQV